MQRYALDIRRPNFRRVLSGVDPLDVDAVLEAAVESYESAYAEREKLREQFAVVSGELSKAREAERGLSRVVVAAEEDACRTRAGATRQVDALIERAERDAAALLAPAEQTRDRSLAELSALASRHGRAVEALEAVIAELKQPVVLPEPNNRAFGPKGPALMAATEEEEPAVVESPASGAVLASEPDPVTVASGLETALAIVADDPGVGERDAPPVYGPTHVGSTEDSVAPPSLEGASVPPTGPSAGPAADPAPGAALPAPASPGSISADPASFERNPGEPQAAAVLSVADGPEPETSETSSRATWWWVSGGAAAVGALLIVAAVGVPRLSQMFSSSSGPTTIAGERVEVPVSAAGVVPGPASIVAPTPPPGESRPAATPEGAVRVNLLARRECWVRVTVDGRAEELTIPAGHAVTRAASEHVLLRVGDAGALVVEVNGEELPPLGADGQVVNRRFP